MMRGLVLGSLALLLGCATTPSTSSEDVSSGFASNLHRVPQPGEKMAEYDLNRDQKPDAWDYTVAGTDADGRPIQRRIRKELDINRDGKIDLINEYDDKELLTRASYDLDFDGKVDQVNYYEKDVLVRKERDLDYNGRPDEWVHFERGKVARKERDSDADGRVDYWEYWESDQVDRIGEDLNGDGKVDRWTKSGPSAQAP